MAAKQTKRAEPCTTAASEPAGLACASFNLYPKCLAVWHIYIEKVPLKC